MGPCTPCEQQANANERDFDAALKNAINYVERTKKTVKVYKRLQQWTFVDVEINCTLSVPGRALVYWDEQSATVQIH